MRLPKFDYLLPSSLEESAQLLKAYGSRARLVAGGTDLYPRMKYGLARPEVVVSLKGVSVSPPVVDPNGDLRLDALTTLHDLARSPIVCERAPLLVEAAQAVGSNEIRHMGTLGGNLCLETRCGYYNQTHAFQFVGPCFKRNGDRCYLIPKSRRCWAVFSADTVPALFSLDAKINITGAGAGGLLPLERLYSGDPLKPIAISEGRIISEVIIPKQVPVQGGAFIKFSMRGGMEFAALNLAVFIEVENDEMICHEARITVGAISGAPLRMVTAEQAIKGQRLSKELFQHASQIAASEAQPFPHHGYSATYLKECLRVQCRRALDLAFERILKRIEDLNQR